MRSRPLLRAPLAAALLFAAKLVAPASAQALTTGLVGRYPLDGDGRALSSQANPLGMDLSPIHHLPCRQASPCIL